MGVWEDLALTDTDVTISLHAVGPYFVQGKLTNFAM